VFASKEFREHCTRLGQELSFSGVGAHHQNGVAERAIQTITNMARANMIHAQLHWPEWAFIDLWPLAMSYAIWVYNKIPHHGGVLSPEELFCGFKNPQSALSCGHVFGCPVYVLEPALQDGK
jgi:transposase InsO family protein